MPERLSVVTQVPDLLPGSYRCQHGVPIFPAMAGSAARNRPGLDTLCLSNVPDLFPTTPR